MVEESKTLRGTITKLHHSSPKWSAAKLLPNRSDVTRGGEVSIAGNFYGVVGEYVILQGQWEDHEKWGRQFRVKQRLHEAGEIAVEGLAGWLAVHGKARGIGPVKAEKLARSFGENFTGILRDNPEQIAIEAGISLEVIKELADDWFEHEELNVIGTKLSVYELTAHQIRSVYEHYGSSCVGIIEDNPYLLVGEVAGLGFKTVDEVAKKVGVPEKHPGRFAAAVQYCMSEEMGNGSTCVERGNLIGSATEILDYRESDGDDLLHQAIEGLVETNRKLVEYDAGERLFYALPGCWKHESAIMEFLESANEPNPNFSSTDVDGLVPTTTGGGLLLDDSQRRAVAMALRSRACLISGGAGCGKTTILQAIVGVYRQDNLRVKLCAPTGKAARRIEEVVGHEAQTIHRMLGYRPPEGFPKTKLDADVVICDEASMIDSSLAYYLFRAIRSETALVLVGDHHQLPPVGAGALLRDCIQNELLPQTILSHCHRQAGPLKTNCSAILHGEVHPTETTEDGSLPWVVLRKFDLSEQVLEYLEKLFVQGLRDRLGVDPLTDVQFLTPQHGGPLGTRSLNILLQRLNQKARGVDVDPVLPDARPKLYAGDKVIQTKNNYKLDVMNGHQGIVVRTEPVLVVNFGDNRILAIPKENKLEIELAYALTAHKCQGSEFPVAVIVVHKSHSFMLHRNWLYTACTRARRSCVIVGDDAGVSRAVKTVRANERRTLLPLLVKVNEDWQV